MGRSFLGLVMMLLFGCNESVAPHPTPSFTTEVVTVTAKTKPSRDELILLLLEQVKQQEQEKLPFDEPRHEFGEQLDGRLRQEWERAYYAGHSFYVYNGDRYTTMYDFKPFVPQVCADFIVDTIDRTAGTWYLPSLKEPGKTMGRHDLRMMVKAAQLDPRRLSELMTYFKQNPESFEIVFEGEGPKASDTKKAQAWMKQLDVQLGDIIIFRGKVPWDDGKEAHNHSMFVTALDNDGQVKLVTGNPVFPVERTLKIEGNRTPKRKIVYIVRLTDRFLARLTGFDDDEVH